MRLSNTQAVARPVAIDRNHTNQTKAVSTGAIAPHAQTTRWTYTVPAGKKTVAQAVSQDVTRVTAAAPAAQVLGLIQYTPNGGAGLNLDEYLLFTNGVGDNRHTPPQNIGDMDAGDALAYITADGSTGGSVSFLSAAKMFEYDA